MLKVSLDRNYEQMADITSEFHSEYTAMLLVQWTLSLLGPLWLGRWAAKQATSPQQAVGYGTVVGLSVLFTYGLMWIALSPVNGLLRLGFLLLVPLAGALGGRWAGANLAKFSRSVPPAIQPQAYELPPQTPWGPAAGSGPDVYYQMGITAAMGARREEARGHFNRVLQMNPYYLPAWLQLANLADTPEQAWNYIQQARAVNPNDPAVVQAVNLIWPQVAANAARSQSRKAEGQEVATEVEFPAIQPPPVIAPPDSPASELPTELDILSERPTLRELPSEPPTDIDQLPSVPDLPPDVPPDTSLDEKEKHSDTFDPWG